MKLDKLMRKVQQYLDADARKRKDNRKDMKILLKKLKLKEQNLAAKALTEFNEEKRKRLRKDIEMVHAQRKKGISALRGMKSKS